MTVEIDELDDRQGFRVRDTCEGEEAVVRTDQRVSPAPAATAALDVPLDTAVEIEAGELHAPVFLTTVFRRGGEVVERVDPDGGDRRLPTGTYDVDFSPPNVKLYVRVEDCAPAVRSAADHTYLDFGEATRLVVGFRSHHERPAGTVTVTEDPRDVMVGVSALGSALKTQSPDRSWPTLRGHPPAIERGTELDVPDAVTPPETGVTLEVPPSYGAVFSVAPLAYYLGATVEAGDHPRLLAAGSEYCFDVEDFSADVRRVLEHVFTLDCVVREAGFYPFRTVLSDALEERVELDYEALFGLSLGERTAAYLDVPGSATAGLLDWHYTADVAPSAENAVALPYLVDELAAVRSPPRQAETATLTPSPNALGDDADTPLARSTASSPPDPLPVAVPEDAGTPGQSWITPDLAPGAANPTVGSFRRAFEWPAGSGSLDVHVVYNDARLDAGDDTAYDTHQTAETNVRVSQSLTTRELREALYEEVDFLHFVGHVTEAGMVCADGVLDVRTLARTGVRAFFLNGCRSYEQGRALLTAGSVGGLVTVDDVADATAGRVGRAVSMLLDAGFPLYAVLDVLGLTGVQADRYAILGSGTLAFRRSPSGTPVLYAFDTDEFDADTDPVPTTAHCYPYGSNGLGTFLSATYTTRDAVIADGSARREWFPRAALERCLDASPTPVLLDGAVRYTPDLTTADFE